MLVKHISNYGLTLFASLEWNYNISSPVGVNKREITFWSLSGLLCKLVWVFWGDRCPYLQSLYLFWLLSFLAYSAISGLLLQNCCNWVSSSEPLDTSVESMLPDCPRVSAGTWVCSQNKNSGRGSAQEQLGYLKMHMDAAVLRSPLLIVGLFWFFFALCGIEVLLSTRSLYFSTRLFSLAWSNWWHYR